jgi:putative phosphoribosyl transferase
MAMADYENRIDAGKQLGTVLKRKSYEQPVVLGIPRGGVVLSSEVTRLLGGDHGVVVARKLGAPFQPELAIGAITASGAAFVDPEILELAHVDEQYLERVKREEQIEAKRREEQFDSRRRPTIAGRTVIIVDDGVATGATAIAAIRAMKQEGASHVVFAVPVGPPHTIARLRQEADDVICLIEEPYFFSVGQFYADFEPVSDREVQDILQVVEAERAASGGSTEAPVADDVRA